MNPRKIKKVIVDYLESEYSDDKLRALLNHTQDAKLSYLSCCCFAGIPSANHKLKSFENRDFTGHIQKDGFSAFSVVNEKLWKASDAFCQIADTDEQRRVRLLPLIEAEVKRRNLK